MSKLYGLGIAGLACLSFGFALQFNLGIGLIVFGAGLLIGFWGIVFTRFLDGK